MSALKIEIELRRDFRFEKRVEFGCRGVVEFTGVQRQQVCGAHESGQS